jgi:uroporphyrinogen-III decarboxylase
MSPREYFRAIMRHEKVDRVPVLALEPFEQTALTRWRGEGLPEGAHPVDFLGMSQLVQVPLGWGPIPAFEQKVISEDDQYVVEVSNMGATVRKRKDHPTLFYGHIDHPVRTRDDWQEYKQRFRASSPGRLPVDWQDTVAPRLNASTDPVGICFFPFFFRLGFYAMGMERFLTAFYDDPDLMHDVFSHWSRFAIEMLEPVLGTVQLDFAMFAEDLAGKNGPLISPEIYQEFWYPYQDPIVDLLRAHDVPVICQWSAGQFERLLPGMIDHGFNCTWPLEAMAGMEAPTLRQRYGRKLLMGGNIPKEAVIAGPEAIDRELDRLLPLIREGGFLPALDDMASPDMPFAHYRHMIERLQTLAL